MHTYLLLFLSLTTCHALVDPDEKSYLISLYDDLYAPSQLTGWGNATSDPCTDGWFGVGCDSSGSHVTSLVLNGGSEGWVPLQAQGRILSSTVGMMSQLQYLSLKKNKFSSFLPSLSFLTNLIYLDLSYNEFSGELMGLTGLSNLQYLILENNNIGLDPKVVQSGSDLDRLRGCSSLRQVKLRNNMLHGNMNVLFGQSIDSLLDVDVAHNCLSGDLHPWTTQQWKLYWLDISFNWFSVSMSGLMYPKLSTLIASNNRDPSTGVKLHGDLSFIYNSPLLSSVDFSSNAFSDELRLKNLSSLSQFQGMGSLIATNNMLTGFLPSDFVPSMNPILRLAGNPFWCDRGMPVAPQYGGQIDASCVNVTLAKALPNYSNDESSVITMDTGAVGGSRLVCDFSGVKSAATVVTPTSLSCPVPYDELRGFPYRVSLAIKHTDHDGAIALTSLDFYGRLPDATETSALKAAFSGWGTPLTLSNWGLDPPTLPCKDWLGVSCSRFDGHVTSLNLFGHRLMAAVSPQLADLHWLRELKIETSQIHGPVNGSIFAGMPDLETLSLSSNVYIVGAIPATVGTLTHLQYLDLGGNRFDGALPGDALGSLRNLTHLDLRFNSLSGRIEPLASLASVQEIDMSMNDLHGSLGPIVQGCKALKRLHVTSNNLAGFLDARLSKIDFEGTGNPFWCPLPDGMESMAACTSVLVSDVVPSVVTAITSNVTVSVSNGAVDVDGIVCTFADSGGVVVRTPATPISPQSLSCPMPRLSAPHWRVLVGLEFHGQPVSVRDKVYFEARPCQALHDCHGHGDCVGIGQCQCTGQWTGADCSGECSGHGTGTAGATCDCVRPWFGPVCAVPEQHELALEMRLVVVGVALVAGIVGVVQIRRVWRQRARSKGLSIRQAIADDIVDTEEQSGDIHMTRHNLMVLVLSFVEAAQLVSFQVNDDIPWWRSMGLKQFLPPFLMDFHGVFVIVFWACVSIVTLWLLLWVNQRTGVLERTRVGRYLARIDVVVLPLIANGLYLPIVTTFVRAWVCWYPDSPTMHPVLVADNGIVCWDNWLHWVYVVTAMVALTLYLPVALRSQRVWTDLELAAAIPGEAVIVFSPAFMEVLLLSKFVQAVAVVTFAGDAWVSLGFSGVLMASVLLFMSRYSVSNVRAVSNWRMFGWILGVWSVISAAVTLVTNDLHHFGSLLLPTGAGVILLYFMYRHRSITAQHTVPSAPMRRRRSLLRTIVAGQRSADEREMPFLMAGLVEVGDEI